MYSMTQSQPLSAFEQVLNLEYINLASHGVKEHLGRRLSDELVIVLFGSNPNECSVALWDLEKYQAINSVKLPFGAGMLWDWDWRAEQAKAVFDRFEAAYHAHVSQASTELSAQVPKIA
jgi:hypothetical protein